MPLMKRVQAVATIAPRWIAENHCRGDQHRHEISHGRRAYDENAPIGQEPADGEDLADFGQDVETQHHLHFPTHIPLVSGHEGDPGPLQIITETYLLPTAAFFFSESSRSPTETRIAIAHRIILPASEIK